MNRYTPTAHDTKYGQFIKVNVLVMDHLFSITRTLQ